MFSWLCSNCQKEKKSEIKLMGTVMNVENSQTFMIMYTVPKLLEIDYHVIFVSISKEFGFDISNKKLYLSPTKKILK